MANWAKKNGILRRSSQHCKRRFKVLQPDKYVEHCKVSKADCACGKLTGDLFPPYISI